MWLTRLHPTTTWSDGASHLTTPLLPLHSRGTSSLLLCGGWPGLDDTANPAQTEPGRRLDLPGLQALSQLSDDWGREGGLY